MTGSVLGEQRKELEAFKERMRERREQRLLKQAGLATEE